MNTTNKGPLPVSVCPVCGYHMDDGTCLDDPSMTMPSPKDLSLCMKCGEVLVYDGELKLSQAGLDDMLTTPKHILNKIGQVQKFIRTIRPLDNKQRKDNDDTD